MNRLLYVITVLLYLSTTAFAAFLNYGGGAENAAMGGSLIASADQAFSAQMNPSLLTQIKSTQIGFEYQQLFTGLSGPDSSIPGYHSVNLGVSNAALDIPFRKLIGTFGFSYLQFSSPGLYSEQTIQMSMARTLNDLILQDQEETIGLGLGIKFLRRSVDTDAYNSPVLNVSGNSASAFTLDLGTFYKPFAQLSAGLALRNLITADVGITREDDVPREIAGGVTWTEPIRGLYRNASVSAMISRREGESRTNFHAGGEIDISYFSPRLGFNRDEFSTGFGFLFGKDKPWTLSLDYAFILPLNLGGTTGTHRFAIVINFGRAGQ